MECGGSTPLWTTQHDASPENLVIAVLSPESALRLCLLPSIDLDLISLERYRIEHLRVWYLRCEGLSEPSASGWIAMSQDDASGAGLYGKFK